MVLFYLFICFICFSCLETIWWHTIEKRFCFDDEIALYEVPESSYQEKNNNIFENAVFYDSVSVIAGRSVVTIEPLPVKLNVTPEPEVRRRIIEPPVIISQPMLSRDSVPKIKLELEDSTEDVTPSEVTEKRLYRSTSDIAESQAEINVIDEKLAVSEQNLEVNLFSISFLICLPLPYDFLILYHDIFISGIPEAKILNYRGSVTDPCGTPDSIFLDVDLASCMPTLNFLFARENTIR